ncbi:ADP-ribosylglycohydrolase family protein [Allostreptomyces psammosilenae]|uniref:ADP-ribosylglycohydrolase family protein n=1 Tax=Allostreptomyces psammosilenae TaxID=1892865 RepID=UPI001FE9D444|nr:ADP-ribosylglycohydrolase family protein [Allostreptomyces psammosilenae]
MRDRVRGCLLAGAVGDALGAGIEFDSLSRIRAQHGPAGVTGYVPAYRRLGAVTDDTQMTLFTVEGLLLATRHDGEPSRPAPPSGAVGARSSAGHLGAAGVIAAEPADAADLAARMLAGTSRPRDVIEVHRAYLRWRSTQVDVSVPPAHPAPEDGWLIGEQWLHDLRAPGTACVSGLSNDRPGTLAEPKNPGSKGCGTVMRAAPFGLLPDLTAEQAFRLAVECSVLTHGHPTGYLSAGALAAVVHALVHGAPPVNAVRSAAALAATWPEHHETTGALSAALAAAIRDTTEGGGPSVEALCALGQGWTAEEALAMAVYCLLAEPDPAAALLLAVNHGGDSDSTGSVTGNLLGALHGGDALARALPGEWLERLEGRPTIERLADEFAAALADRLPPAGTA